MLVVLFTQFLPVLPIFVLSFCVILIYRVIKNDCRGFNLVLQYATPCDFFLWAYVKDQVYVPPLPRKYPGTEGANQNRH